MDSEEDVLSKLAIENKVKIIRTCSECPEQYDVYAMINCDNSTIRYKEIGYLRLRHGEFSATYPNVYGIEVYYNKNIMGDGSFYDDNERYREMSLAIRKLLEHHYPNRIKLII